MCNFASGVLSRYRAFWSTQTDAHTAIIAEHRLYADGIRGPNLLQYEITPPEYPQVLGDLAAWKYRVDQDDRPECFEPRDAESRARAALHERLSPYLDDLRRSEFEHLAKTASDAGVRWLAVDRLTDEAVLAEQAVLAEVAKTASDAGLRWTAVDRLTDQAVLGEVAKTDSDGAVRLHARFRLRIMQ